jgi:hypothetical protein
MKNRVMYIELKTGYNDNGPAWIGKVFFSKSGQTIYFNGKAFKRLKKSGISGNYMDLISGEEYWISGVKKDRTDRHWVGSGKIQIEEDIIEEYLKIVKKEKLEKSRFIVIKPNRPDIRSNIYEIENKTLYEEQYKLF